MVALDLSAAFDTCNHKILLETFQNYYGKDGKVISWITSYLRGHSCVVNVNGKTSKPKQLPLSVPQGSCSGAFYFILYASTIFEEIEDSVNLYGFADGHILSKSFKANDRMSEAEAILDLEDSAIDVKIWMDGVKLKMNPDKTEFILYGNRVQLQKCVTQQIEITGDKITRNSVIRYLGGFLDETFSLKHHVQKKCAAAMINFNKN